jgi:HemX protein
MTSLLELVNALLPLLYGAVAGVYAVLLAGDPPWARRAGPRLLWSVLGIHLLFVAGEAWVLGRHPVANKFELFTLVALAVAASYAWVEWRRGIAHTGVFPLGLAFLLQVCSSLGRVDDYAVPEILRSPLFAWHAGAAAVAWAALSVGAVYGGLYLVMYRHLKTGSLGEFTLRMPSLDVLAAMSLHAVEVGFAALTVAVGLGDVWVMRSPGATMADPKVWSTFLVWSVYGACLLGRFAAGWGGARVVILQLAGYGLLLASMLTVGRVFGTFHRFAG